LGEILTHDIFKQSQEELHDNLNKDKKKIVTFKAKTSNDDIALMVKKFMKKKCYQGGSSKDNKSYSKNPFAKKKCLQVW
jgi:hypothetical protein